MKGNLTNKWNQGIGWLEGKFNKYISPISCRIWGNTVPANPNQGSHGGNKDRKSEGDNKWTDPKAKVLSKFRNRSGSQDFEEKIRRVNAYFSQKVQNPDKPGDLLCPICLQFMVKPVLTACGHNFCMMCLDQTLLFKTECPSCRAFLRGCRLTHCSSLEQIILREIVRHPCDQYEGYHELLHEADEWLLKRRPDPLTLEIGTKLDIRDTEEIWCKGSVRQIYLRDNRMSAVLVHYEGWNSIYDEVIEVSSDRLANYGFYTQRSDIPHYSGGSIDVVSQDRMFSNVIIDQQERIDGFMIVSSDGTISDNENEHSLDMITQEQFDDSQHDENTLENILERYSRNMPQSNVQQQLYRGDSYDQQQQEQDSNTHLQQQQQQQEEEEEDQQKQRNQQQLINYILSIDITREIDFQKIHLEEGPLVFQEDKWEIEYVGGNEREIEGNRKKERQNGGVEEKEKGNFQSQQQSIINPEKELV